MRDEEGWKLFLNLCSEAKKSAHLEDVFSLFFTIEEREHLASRMQIIHALLSSQLSQREISEEMKVSISQITRGSNALKIVNKDFLKFLETFSKRHKK